MSLINEALKKAQRSRGEAVSHPEPTVGAGRLKGANGGRFTVVLAAGAVLLVVLSAAVTALWLNRPAAPATVTAAPSLHPPPPMAPAAPRPQIVTPAPRPKPALDTPVPARAEHGLVVVPISPPAPAAGPVEPPGKIEPAPPRPDARIHQYVESLKVAGIRAADADSRVLMNDRVYRVNDIVNPALGLRLTKVATDSLTFTDSNGITYVKYF